MCVPWMNIFLCEELAASVLFAFGFGFGKSFASKTSCQAAKQRRKLQLQFLVFSTTNIYVYNIYKYVCVCACYFVPIAGGKHFRSGQRKIEAFPVCLQKKKINYEISASLLLQLCCRLLSLMWLLFFFMLLLHFAKSFSAWFKAYGWSLESRVLISLMMNKNRCGKRRLGHWQDTCWPGLRQPLRITS